MSINAPESEDDGGTRCRKIEISEDKPSFAMVVQQSVGRRCKPISCGIEVISTFCWREDIADGLTRGVAGSDGAAIDDPSGNLNVWESKPIPWHGTPASVIGSPHHCKDVDDIQSAESVVVRASALPKPLIEIGKLTDCCMSAATALISNALPALTREHDCVSWLSQVFVHVEDRMAKSCPPKIVRRGPVAMGAVLRRALAYQFSMITR
ncbi:MULTISPECIES: hypothetical protein [Phyllobacteriaceae]|uniref:hypothetical protein n=1 Tax=Phyllobacteriaceae TaxID=69277 RepID=UPI0017FE39D9|nr:MULTISPECIES: hypothetical protein [Mesorhizobium]MDQ0329182.1 hypothetical protein [Mesorhizobium sp. YL-MeA3-2017]